MTLIFNSADFWIESISAEYVALASGANDQIDVNFEKPGRFVGCSDMINYGTSTSTLVNALVRKLDNTSPNYGDAITAIRSRVRNDSGVPQNISHRIIVFLKR